MLPANSIKNFVSIVLIFFIISASYAQKDKKAKLQQNKKNIEKEISYTNKLLRDTKKSKKVSLNQLVLIKNKIGKRQELITTINYEISYLDKEIKQTQAEIEKLTQDLKNLKDEYAKMVYFAYKNMNSYDRLMFIFSAEDFNQAYRRLKYLQQYNSYRKMQAELITKTRVLLNEKKNDLEQQKSEKVELLITKESEKNLLNREKKKKNNTVVQLKRKEKKLLKKIRLKEAQARRLQKEIQAIIAAEMRKSGAKSPKYAFSLTPEEKILSNSFSTNKGKLPWPSERGIVSSTYGVHPHPVLNQIVTENFGIDILTSKNAMARAVFKGTVRFIISISNTKAVGVKHGEYFTLYSNLDEVYVTKGETVSTKQIIGKVHTDSEDNKTELHFELWKGDKKQNPAYWLARKK